MTIFLQEDGGLVLSGTQLIFFTEARMVLCFEFLMKIGMITQMF